MGAASANPFAAQASALGYAFQFRYALHRALSDLSSGCDWEVLFEAGDDIEVRGLSDRDLLQMKHRAAGTVLTDVSPDLWKTLRVWAEGVTQGSIDLRSTRLYLITTAQVSVRSVAYLLRDDPTRDVAAAAVRLRDVAATSKSQSNEPAYTAFGALDLDTQERLLASVTILTSEPDMTTLESGLERMAALAVRRDRIHAFLDRLEGWWIRRGLEQLAGGRGDGGIQGTDFDAAFADIREALVSPDALPIDDELELLECEIGEFRERLFLRQLELVGVSERRVALAVRDYVRAFEQRSRWSREGLVRVGEIERYDRRLVDAWNVHFEQMCDDIGPDLAEDARRERARQLYKWVETALIPIRPACLEGFISRGSFQSLADDGRVGWHVDFMARLVAVLEPADTGVAGA